MRAAGPEKGARLTTDITLPGRLLVLTPRQPGVTVSKSIAGAVRQRLAALGAQIALPDIGFILRSAAAMAEEADIRAELAALTATWRQIEAKAKTVRPPMRLHRDLDPRMRILRERLNEDISRVLIDDAGAVADAKAWCRAHVPQLESRIEKADEVFAGFEVDIALLSARQLPLADGGRITIEHTQALTAIDVDLRYGFTAVIWRFPSRPGFFRSD